jgi:hypothetical protein
VLYRTTKSTPQGVLAAPARRPPCPGSLSCRRHGVSPAHPASLICFPTLDYLCRALVFEIGRRTPWRSCRHRATLGILLCPTQIPRFPGAHLQLRHPCQKRTARSGVGAPRGARGGRDRAVSGQFSSGKPHLGGRWLPQWLRSANWAPGPRGGAAAPRSGFQGFQPGAEGRAWRRGTLARVCSHFPERLGAVTAAATRRARARCRPSAAPPGGGAHRPACDGAVSARCWLGKPHLGGE